MPRALLIVLDSLGCGGAEDAAAFGDTGADTFGHIVEACANVAADRDGLRAGPLKIPFMESLGLSLAARASTGRAIPSTGSPLGAFGYGVETSMGKDTPSGHWEIAGAPLDFDWGYFPDTNPAFPAELTRAIIAQGQLPGILGDRRAAGTAIIDVLGEEHLRTGKPILYTSADSVLQIAAHEETFGLDRLYDLCKLTRKLVVPLRVGRVIARPFVGARAGLGMLLIQYDQAMQIAPLFAILVLLGVIGFAINYAVRVAERKYCFWAQRGRHAMAASH